MRQREGIVGGIGGFFGKRCVEVDASPPPRSRSPRRRRPRYRPRAVTSAYTGRATAADAGARATILDDIFRLAARRAVGLRLTLAERDRAQPEPEPGAGAGVRAGAGVEPEPSRSPRLAPVREEAPRARSRLDAPASSRAPASAAVRTSPSGRLDRGARAERRARASTTPRRAPSSPRRKRNSAPSTADEPFVNQVRAVLGAADPDARGSARRAATMIALVGPPAVGKTAAAAKLCHAQSRAGAACPRSASSRCGRRSSWRPDAAARRRARSRPTTGPDRGRPAQKLAARGRASSSTRRPSTSCDGRMGAPRGAPPAARAERDASGAPGSLLTRRASTTSSASGRSALGSTGCCSHICRRAPAPGWPRRPSAPESRSPRPPPPSASYPPIAHRLAPCILP